jgi:hypothetical protein
LLARREPFKFIDGAHGFSINRWKKRLLYLDVFYDAQFRHVEANKYSTFNALTPGVFRLMKILSNSYNDSLFAAIAHRIARHNLEFKERNWFSIGREAFPATTSFINKPLPALKLTSRIV